MASIARPHSGAYACPASDDHYHGCLECLPRNVQALDERSSRVCHLLVQLDFARRAAFEHPLNYQRRLCFVSRMPGPSHPCGSYPFPKMSLHLAYALSLQ